MYQYTLYNAPETKEQIGNETIITKEPPEESIFKLMPIIVIVGIFLLYLKGQEKIIRGRITRDEAEQILKNKLREIITNEKYSGFPSGELVVTPLGKETIDEPYVWWIPYIIREKHLGIGTEQEHWYIGKVSSIPGSGYIGSIIVTDKDGRRVEATGAEGGFDFKSYPYTPTREED